MPERAPSEPAVADLKIINGLLLTGASQGEVVEKGTVVIHRGLIVYAGSAENSGDTPAERVLDADGKLVMPGLVNTHTHAPMTCFRGLADDLPLMQWLEEYIFPVEERFVDPELVYWGSMLSCLEMMLSGTTTFADGYFFEEAVARAVLDAGLRAVASQGVIDFPAPGVPDPSQNVAHAERFLREWGGRSSRLTCGVFCHSPYTCSPDTLRRAKAAARNADVPLFIHLCETKTEVDQIRGKHGCTPVEHLDRLDVLDGRTVGVHCVWLTPGDMDILAARAVPVSYTPESEMKLGSGVAPVPELLGRGVVVSLGTDGASSNNDLDMFAEMDVSAKLQKVHNLDPTCLAARETVRMATMGGAQALGLQRRIGSLEPGKQADLIVLDMNKPHLTPLYDVHSHLVYAVKGSDVDTVIVDGRILVEGGRPVHLNEQEILDRVRALGRKISKQIRPHGGAAASRS